MLKPNSASIQRRYLLREQRKLSMSTIKQRYCVTKIHQNVYVKVCTTALLIVRFKLNYSLTGFLCSHCFCTFHNKLYTVAITLTRWKHRGSIWKTFSSYNMKTEEHLQVCIGILSAYSHWASTTMIATSHTDGSSTLLHC